MESPGNNVTMLLEAAVAGDKQAGSALLPLVYEELRKLASARLAKEPGGGAGYTLQPTALVHEAYMRLLGQTAGGSEIRWEGRGHFFAAAALAMRRILVDRARHRGRVKHGGEFKRADVEMDVLAAEPPGEELLALDEALTKLEKADERKYRVVMLRYFAGLSIEDTAAAIGVSAATVKNDWVFARAWLKRAVVEGGERGDASSAHTTPPVAEPRA
ncbi:MAG: sigma-70 family RNA polymerase sigma factor [Phycisphaerales bacterium]